MSCDFFSSLKSLKAYLPSDPLVVRQILQPIFSRSSCLSSAKIYTVTTPLSSNFTRILIAANPIRLTAKTFATSTYRFHEIVDESLVAPRVKRLTLMWPSPIGTETERQKRGRIYARPPDLLKFEHCRNFAAMFPGLNIMKFKVDDEHMEAIWPRRWLRSNVTSSIPLQSDRMGTWWVTYLNRLQSLKMGKFIDACSPCLNLCTLLFHFEDPDCERQTTSGSYLRQLVIFVSLDQVRKHRGP